MVLIKEIIEVEKFNMFENVLRKLSGCNDDIIALLYKEKDDGTVSASIIDLEKLISQGKVKKYLSLSMTYTDVVELAKKYGVKVYKFREGIEEERI